jgi:phage shock protein A
VECSITEATLELRTNELTMAQGELLKARQDAEGAFELASRIRAREEEGKSREREMEHKTRAAEEERRMADFVVAEYADLVRSLEGRKSSLPPKVPPKSPTMQENEAEDDWSPRTTPALMDSYAEGKKGLKRLLCEFSAESERLEEKIAKLERELATAETRWETERKVAELDRALLAKVQAELVKLRIDDKAAARMVSRYM